MNMSIKKRRMQSFGCNVTQTGRKLDEPPTSILRVEEMLPSSALMMEAAGFSETVSFLPECTAMQCRRQYCLQSQP